MSDKKSMGRLVRRLGDTDVLVIEHCGEQLFLARTIGDDKRRKVCFWGPKSFYIHPNKLDENGNVIEPGHRTEIKPKDKRMVLAYDRGADGKKDQSTKD